MTPQRPSTDRLARHRDLAWTSFDRFGRYAAVSAALEGAVPGVPAFVVDVGDRSGYLRHFFPDVPSVAIDLKAEPDAFSDLVFAVADGRTLPLADGSAPAVACCDVLEHLPEDAREPLVRELSRVATGPIVLAAPFDTFGVAGVESVVSRFATVIHGHRQPQLAEHEHHGLPDLARTVEAFTALGWDVRVRGDGNLVDWLGLMILRFGAEARDEMKPLGDGIDIVYNHLLSERSDLAPYYRHVLTATPMGGASPVVTGLEEALAIDHRSLDVYGTAFLTQLGLLDLVPRLDVLDRRVSDLARFAQHRADTVDSVVSSNVAEVVRRLDGLAEDVRRLEALTADVGERTFHSTLRRQFRRIFRR